jgi:hypothetical protein
MRTYLLKNTSQKGLVEQLKVEALSSSLRTTKNQNGILDK